MVENGKTLFVVTGASGGFGSAILRQIDALYGNKATIIACSRNRDSVLKNSKDFTADLKWTSIDFAEREDLNGRCQTMLQLSKDEQFSEVVLFNNHASTNDISRLFADFDDHKEIDDYMFLNVTSFHILTSLFLKEFRGEKDRAVTVVNVSSLCAVVAIPSLSLYSGGKAARMMVYKVLNYVYLY